VARLVADWSLTSAFDDTRDLLESEHMPTERKPVDTELHARLPEKKPAPARVPPPYAGSAIVRPTVTRAVMPGHPAYSEHPAQPPLEALARPAGKVSPMVGYPKARGGMNARPTGSTGPSKQGG
jgi:hypothetical protein